MGGVKQGSGKLSPLRCDPVLRAIFELSPEVFVKAAA